MPHQDVFLNGQRHPSVTEITNVLSKGDWLLKYYGKHGNLKLFALADALGVDRDAALKKIPDSFFDDSRIEREDFWKNADDLKEKARNRGEGMHAVFEDAAKAYLSGQKPNLDNPYVFAVDYWLKKKGFSIKAFEKFVVSKEYSFGGTFDALVESGQGEAVVDWKFTSRLNHGNVLQLAGYDICLGGPPRPGYLIRLYETVRPAKVDSEKQSVTGIMYSFAGKTVKIEEHFIENLGKYHEDFINCLKLLKFLKTYPI